MEAAIRPVNLLKLFRTGAVSTVAVACLTSVTAAQTAPTRSACAAPPNRLQSRVTCFVQVRQHGDSAALMRLIHPAWVIDKASYFRRLYQVYLLTPNSLSREVRLRHLATAVRLSSSEDTTDLDTDVRQMDAIFAALERGESAQRFLRPAFAFLFFEQARLLQVEVVESSVNRTSDTTATLYLTERATSPFSDVPIDVTRRRTFAWARHAARWYLSPDR
jgi:hypothetical protein